jgi:iron complex outermembrane receptor protein
MLKARPLVFAALVLLSIVAAAPLVAAPQTSTSSPQQPTPADKQPLRYEDTASVEAKAPAVPPPADTATKLEANVRDLPVSVSVVSGRLAAEQAGMVLTDALKNASGVNVATGFGIFDYWVVRGFDSLDTGLVLVDGAADPEAVLYPLYNVQQVEVLKGPGAFAWGGGALSGTTQVVRKNPVVARFADLTLAYGRYGTYEAAVDGNASSASGKVAFRLNATLQGTDGFRDGRDGQIAAFNPGLAWRPDARTRIALSYEYLTSEQSPDSGLPFVDGSLAGPSLSTSYQSASDVSEQDVQRFRVDAQRRLNDTFLLRDKLYYSQLDWLSNGTLINGAFPFPPDFRTYVVRTQGLLDDSQRLFGNQLELVASFRTGPVAHELVTGFEMSRLSDTYTQDAQLVQPLDLMQPVEFELGIYPIPIPQAHQAGDSRSLVLAPYLIDKMNVSSSLELLAGARFDSVDFEDDATGTTRDESRLSPVGGIVWKPVSTVSVYASGGLGFAPPSIQVVGPRDPEESTQLEGGVKVSFLEGKGYASAAVYQLERENIAIPDSTGLTRQSGSQRSRGFELELSTEPKAGWSVRANYAFNDAELTSFAEIVQTAEGFFVVDHSGNVPAFAPRHIGSLWATAPLPYGLSLAAGLRCVSDQFVSADNRNQIDTYAVADAAIFYTRNRARVGVHFRNLTSSEYATRGFGSESAIPGRPFEVLGRVELGFGSR